MFFRYLAPGSGMDFHLMYDYPIIHSFHKCESGLQPFECINIDIFV